MFYIRYFGLILALVFSSVQAQEEESQSNSTTSPNPGSPGNATSAPIQVEPPKTDDFFSQGRKFFPENFQNEREEVNIGKIGGSNQVTPDYPVGSGDQFLINFWGRIEDNIIVTIDTEGRLFMPRLGVLDTEGMTYADFRKALTELIQSKMKKVQFTISLYKARSFTVYVLGSVGRPGAVSASATNRADQVIARAGGVKSTGSRQFIELRRKGKVLRIDLLKYEASANFKFNPLISDGDLIFVPDISDFASISGAVVRSGTFEILETKKLVDVIDIMGGFSVYADRTRPIQLSRLDSTGARRKIDVLWKEEQRRSSSDILLEKLILQRGDEIFVGSTQILIPSQNRAVFVTGAVVAPGPKKYNVSSSIEEYVGLAGGLKARANFSGTTIYKSDGTSVKVEPRVAIEPGDTIHVPEQTFMFWQDHVAVLTTFLGLATSIIVLSGK